MLTLLAVSCVPNEQKSQMDHSIEKTEYKGALKYFTDRYGQEIYEPINQNSGFYITLPECFEIQNFNSISLTGKFTRFCKENSTYITIDAIAKEDVSFYKAYFENKETKGQSNLQILIDYVMEIRNSNLINAQKSVYSSLITHHGKKMLLGTVTGKEHTYANELSYQYGVVSLEDNYYVLQAISEISNYKYLRQDILEIFKSFRAR